MLLATLQLSHFIGALLTLPFDLFCCWRRALTGTGTPMKPAGEVDVGFVKWGDLVTPSFVQAVVD